MKMKKVLENQGLFLAEMERFELSRRLSRPTPLAGAPLRPLEYISVLYLRERPFAELADNIIHYFYVFVKTFLSFSYTFIIIICFSFRFFASERLFLTFYGVYDIMRLKNIGGDRNGTQNFNRLYQTAAFAFQ